jgi:hypothetical protein
MPSLLKKVAKKCALALPLVGPYVRNNGHLRSFFPWGEPDHYYSPIPALEQVRAREVEIWRREETKAIPGIDLNEQAQLRLLDQLAQYFPE